VETAATFDPAVNALDFYESLEGMLVRVTDAVATGPTNDFGEISVLPGNFGSPRTVRAGVRYTYADANAERVILDDNIAATPTVNTGDRFPGNVDGVLDYSFGNYKLHVLATPTVTPGGLVPEKARPQRLWELAIATYNVENLDPGDPVTKFDRLAAGLVTGLASPDIVALEEVQDNTGPTNDGVVAADVTYRLLIEAIRRAGGPRYEFRQVDPVSGADGGEPGGNIRVGFLFRTDRGVSFVDRSPGDATTPTDVVRGPQFRAQLTRSPGRIDPTNTAFANSRKPLAGEFRFRGHTVFVVANHFNSKGGDEPLFGRFQPPTRSSEVQRHQQATAVRAFVSKIKSIDALASVVVLGDINDFEFSTTTNILVGSDGWLVSLPRTLPENERYSYVFDGNSQVLDQILVSKPALFLGFDYDVVHLNAEFADQASDHDPQVVRLIPIF
jgi:predicted extracellular nuclease